MTIIYSPTATINIKGFGTSPDFTISFTKTVTASTGNIAGQRTENDKVYDIVKNVGDIPSYTVQVTSANNLGTISYTSKTPDVFCIDKNNTLLLLSPGIGTLRVCTKYGCQEVAVDFTGDIVATSERIAGYTDGSLGEAIWRASIPRLQSASYGATTQMQWTTITRNRPLLSNTVTPNPNFILSDVDLSFIDVLKDYVDMPNYNYPVMLISPRHFVAAGHVNSASPGKEYLFRQPNGTLITAQQVTAETVIGDLVVGYLDRDITTITPVSIFGTDVYQKTANWSSPVTNKTGFPTFVRLINATNVTDPANSTNPLPAGPKIAATQTLGNVVTPLPISNLMDKVVDPTLLPWSQEPYSGDSSSPVFCLLPQNGRVEPVLLFNLYGPYSGPELTAYRTQILAKMHELAVANGDNRTYTLRTPDLSKYPNFS